MLSLNYFHTHTGRLIPVMLAVLFLAGCPSQVPQGPSTQQVEGKAGATSDYYLQQMQQSSDNNKAAWQLLAIRSLFQEGKLPQASAQLNALPTQLSDSQRQEQHLLTAEIAAAQNDTAVANTALGQLDVASLSESQLARYYQVQISINQGHPSLTLIRAYIAQEPLLQGDAHQKNIDLTWSALTKLSAQDLMSIAIKADENTLQGWLDLLTAYQGAIKSPADLKTAIEYWQKRYPHHPAAKTLPTALIQAQSLQPSAVNNIALLLPLNGQAQVFADAIQQGFNAARSGQVSINTPAVPTPSAPALTTPDQATTTPQTQTQTQTQTQNDTLSTPPSSAEYSAASAPTPSPTALPANTVKVYDTSTQPLANVIAQAQQDGASLIVGPLLKNEVDQLPGMNSTLNILALNQPEHIQNRPNICYFALSPEDEARDAAQFIHSQGKQHPLILAPRGNLGDRVVMAFANAWQQLGGTTALQQRIGGVDELKQAMNRGAGLTLTGQPVMTSTAQSLPSTTGAGLTIPAQVQPVASVSTNGNVDAVYIIATPDELSLIKPMIDMRTQSQNRPALYASSRSYQADLGPDFRLEMEGLQFSEIPLLAGSNPTLMQQVSHQFKNDYSLVRLYAMGMDAWSLASHFTQMRQLPGYQIAGATGTLSATPDCVINRKLTWLQFRQGQLVPAS